jgi:hypothetical protein
MLFPIPRRPSTHPPRYPCIPPAIPIPPTQPAPTLHIIALRQIITATNPILPPAPVPTRILAPLWVLRGRGPIIAYYLLFGPHSIGGAKGEGLPLVTALII